MSTDTALQSLYPFLHGRPTDPGTLHATLLESVHAKALQSCEVKRRFFAEHGAAVVAVAQVLADSFRGGGRLFCIGNGGSSCDAAHVAVEFLHPVTAGRPALAAVNLTADVAMLTAVANDVGVEHVFVRQLIALARHGDTLLGISTSGNSRNLLAAFHEARRLGLATIGLSGMDGGHMASCADVDHCLTVSCDSVHRIQETHVAIYHMLWDLVHTLLADSRSAIAQAAP